jgi:hypothetical protein
MTVLPVLVIFGLTNFRKSDICLIVLAPDFITKICKKAAQHFYCAESKVFTIEKSVGLWSALISKTAQGP